MNEVYYKIFFGLIVFAMNVIRFSYKKRYKVTHASKVNERKPLREKVLVFIMAVALFVPGILWLFTPFIKFAQFPLLGLYRSIGVVVGGYSVWLFYKVHKTLGDNWSPVLEIRKEHELIITGPYRFVRHPMYSAMLLWGVTFSLLTANWVYVLSFWSGILLLLVLRIPEEEKLMIDQFGEAYKVYQKKVKRFIPYLF